MTCDTMYMTQVETNCVAQHCKICRRRQRALEHVVGSTTGSSTHSQRRGDEARRLRGNGPDWENFEIELNVMPTRCGDGGFTSAIQGADSCERIR